MSEEHNELKDWRGTPINIGDTVIYTASHGRSSSLVEATVRSFTDKGRVILDVVRESFGYREGKPVNVAADRVTVVGVLPPSNRPTHREDKIAAKTNLLASYAADLAKMEAGEPLENKRDERSYYTIEYVRERVAELNRELEALRG